MGSILAKIAEMFLTRKRIIGYGSAIIIAIAAAFLGMPSLDVKKLVCDDSPVLEVPKQVLEQVKNSQPNVPAKGPQEAP